MKKIFQTLMVLVLLLNLSCDPFNNVIENNSEEENAIYYTAKSIKSATPSGDTLKVVTWNIKFGGGRIDFFFDCHGDRVLMTKDEVITNMDGVIENIKAMNPDVIFLQEADINSKRAAFVDQIQMILDNTDLNYGVYGSQWKSDYVPSDGIGRMNSGNAILSKYELFDAKRIPLSLIEEQAGIVQYFYLRRNLLEAKMKVSGYEFYLLGTHTSAYATDGTKKKQLAEIKTETEKIAKAGKTFILGGDFNTIPPNSLKYNNYDDDVCSHESGFAGEDFKESIDDMKIFTETYPQAITQAMYDADNSKYFSFTSDSQGFWNRKLDYIFTNGNFAAGSGMVHQDVSTGGVATMPLSDHAPVSVKFLIK